MRAVAVVELAALVGLAAAVGRFAGDDLMSAVRHRATGRRPFDLWSARELPGPAWRLGLGRRFGRAPAS
ncbi:hypothetical protein ACWC5I_20325 [Kitasatospora sp. NPDC001574]